MILEVLWSIQAVFVVGKPLCDVRIPSRASERAEREILGMILGVLLANSGRTCGPGATLWCRKYHLSPNTFTQDHLLKTKWLVANVTAAVSPDRAEPGILGITLDVFWLIQVAVVVGEPICDAGIPKP